jgi:hypothetical protein
VYAAQAPEDRCKEPTMRKIAVLMVGGLLLVGLLAAPASAQEETRYVPDIILPEIIERPVTVVQPPAPPAVEPPLAVTGLDVTVGMALAALLVLGGTGTLLVARRRSRARA